MTACARHLTEPSAGHRLRHIDLPKMLMVVSIAASDTSRSLSPALMLGCSFAPKRSPGARV